MFLTKPDKSEMDPSSREASQQAEKFKSAQANDPTLTHWRNLAERGSNTFIIVDGILWKRKPPQVLSDNEWLLCLPAEYRDKVLRTAHDSLYCGGHTSHRRTLIKLRRTFAFPRDITAVKNYCKSCEVCARKTAKHRKDKVEIYPIPVIGEFAETWCCDLLGLSLSPTARRKKTGTFASVSTRLRAIHNSLH